MALVCEVAIGSDSAPVFRNLESVSGLGLGLGLGYFRNLESVSGDSSGLFSSLCCTLWRRALIEGAGATGTSN